MFLAAAASASGSQRPLGTDRTGGYGRGELNPSAIHVMLLHGDGAADANFAARHRRPDVSGGAGALPA